MSEEENKREEKMAHEAGKRAVFFGASGVAGDGILSALLADARLEELIVVGRRPLQNPSCGEEIWRCAKESGRVTETILEDFEDCSALLGKPDDIFWALGVQSGKVTKAEYEKITLNYALAAGRHFASDERRVTFHFLSGEGAKKNSWFHWGRTKAATEQALTDLPGVRCVSYRAAWIVPMTKARFRTADKIFQPLVKVLSVFGANMKITALQLGKAMAHIAFESAANETANGTILSNGDILKRTAAYERETAEVHP